MWLQRGAHGRLASQPAGWARPPAQPRSFKFLKVLKVLKLLKVLKVLKVLEVFEILHMFEGFEGCAALRRGSRWSKTLKTYKKTILFIAFEVSSMHGACWPDRTCDFAYEVCHKTAFIDAFVRCAPRCSHSVKILGM